MRADEFELNLQLQNDTHGLFETNDLIVLLHKNEAIPWIIIVPKTERLEVFDLPEELQNSLNKLTKHIAHYFKKQFAVEKMNIAAIGNVVSQLHIHVIGRKVGDACWPDVVWGNEYVLSEYTAENIETIRHHLTL